MYKVFIADDEPFIQEGLQYIIQWEKVGLEIIHIASNGLEVLKAMENTSPDILITDIRMPEMDGLELIRTVKAKKPDIKFIVLSGYDDFEYLKESVKLGIENYLLKPVNREELLSTLINTISKIESNLYRKGYLPEDIRIIRDNVFYRWATHSIDNEELARRAELLQIDLNGSSYCACIIKVLSKRDKPVDNKKNVSSVITEVYEICRHRVEGHNLGSVFCTPTGDVAILFTGREENIEKTFIKDILKECIQDIKKKSDINTFITIGQIENEYSFFHRSFDCAVKLMEYRFIMPPDRILDNEGNKQFSRGTDNMNPLIKRVLEYIDSNYHEDISIKTLANKTNTNANYLGQLF